MIRARTERSPARAPGSARGFALPLQVMTDAPPNRRAEIGMAIRSILKPTVCERDSAGCNVPFLKTPQYCATGVRNNRIASGCPTYAPDTLSMPKLLV